MIKKCIDCGWRKTAGETGYLIYETHTEARCFKCYEINDHPSTPTIKFMLEIMIKNWQHLAKTEIVHDFYTKKVKESQRAKGIESSPAS